MAPQSTWVGKVEGGLGGVSCRLMRRVARQVRVAVGEQAAEHGPCVIWASMLLCARSKVTDTSLCCCGMICSHSKRLGLAVSPFVGVVVSFRFAATAVY